MYIFIMFKGGRGRVDIKGIGSIGKKLYVLLFIYKRCWYMVILMLLFMSVLKFMLLYKSRFCRSKFCEF